MSPSAQYGVARYYTPRYTQLSMPDTALLRAALAGYESQLADIDERIAAIKGQLGGRSSVRVPSKRGRMSAAARRRIADAQRKRWREYRNLNK